MKMSKKQIDKLLGFEEDAMKSIRSWKEDYDYDGLVTEDGLVVTKYLWMYMDR
jgi:hypothetical protein